MPNKRTPCSPAEKWRFDNTDPHCSAALVVSPLICKLNKNFFAESPLLCMAHLLERVGKQKKNLNFPLDKGQRPLMRECPSPGVC